MIKISQICPDVNKLRADCAEEMGFVKNRCARRTNRGHGGYMPQPKCFALKGEVRFLCQEIAVLPPKLDKLFLGCIEFCSQKLRRKQ